MSPGHRGKGDEASPPTPRCRDVENDRRGIFYRGACGPCYNLIADRFSTSELASVLGAMNRRPLSAHHGSAGSAVSWWPWRRGVQVAPWVARGFGLLPTMDRCSGGRRSHLGAVCPSSWVASIGPSERCGRRPMEETSSGLTAPGRGCWSGRIGHAGVGSGTGPRVSTRRHL
jgi:hypothetical protein